jgi:Glycosyl transferase family 2
MKLITIIYDDIQLLPQFIWHYSALGVSEFLIGVYENIICYDKIKEITQSYDCYLFAIKGRYDGQRDTTQRHELAARFVGPDEWWVVADLDEFHEYPDSLRELCLTLDAGGFQYLQSHFLDRITEDGSSPDLKPFLPLWAQFPAGAYITEQLNKRKSSKIMLVRGHAKTVSGHHAPIPGGQQKIFKGGIVHHFKWHGDIVTKIRKRQKSIRRRGYSYHTKLNNFLDFWDRYHRLPIAGEFGFHLPQKPFDWPEPTFPVMPDKR